MKKYQSYRPFEKFFEDADQEKDSFKKEIFLKWKEQKQLKKKTQNIKSN